VGEAVQVEMTLRDCRLLIKAVKAMKDQQYELVLSHLKEAVPFFDVLKHDSTASYFSMKIPGGYSFDKDYAFENYKKSVKGGLFDGV
jgi:hypothetical protein